MIDFLNMKNEYIKLILEGVTSDEVELDEEELSELVEELSEFQEYKNIQSFKINWAEENNALLATVGLPVSAPTMLEFTPAELIAENQLKIGFNNYGDDVVILIDTGVVAYVNHDLNNAIRFINSDALSLLKTLSEFNKVINGERSFPSVLSCFDAKAFKEGAWWHNEYHNWIELN